MIKFILIAGMWVNPMHISILEKRPERFLSSEGCNVYVVGSEDISQYGTAKVIKVGMTCEEMKKEIENDR